MASLSNLTFSDPDQPARFAAQKAADSSRALRIEEHFQPGRLAGVRILITGGNRGFFLDTQPMILFLQSAQSFLSTTKSSNEFCNRAENKEEENKER